MRLLVLALLCIALASPHARSQPVEGCGSVISLATHEKSVTAYAFRQVPDATVALVLLVGGSGDLALDGRGCPRTLGGNALVRALPHLQQLGFTTALVDVPSDLQGEDGLGAFRNTPSHAEDLGKVIADVRVRSGAAVWVIGHSRGTISAANAASRLSGPSGPDGVALLSAMMVGDPRARKAYAAQTVFDLPLSAIAVPLLVVGHAADTCVRSPPGLMHTITEMAASLRRQVVVIGSDPNPAGGKADLDSCEGARPHNFVRQEEGVATAIARFIGGDAR